MELQKINSTKINRKKFFSSVGTGVISYFILKTLPFSLFGKRVENKKVIIEINPDAVRRTNKGEKNV